jgi:predicted nucleic acid-binding protein
MKKFLLDTNILSEVRKGERRADPHVWQWWLGVRNAELFLSVLVLGEIRKGIERLAPRDPVQARTLEKWLLETERNYRPRLLEVTWQVADRWGCIQAIRPVPAVDALIAATASVHNLTLATRNDRDFVGLDIRVVNPFH